MNIPKLSILYILFNIIFNISIISINFINLIFSFFIIFGFIIGSISPYGISNIKKILTYSTINQLGFITIPFIICNFNSIFIF